MRTRRFILAAGALPLLSGCDLQKVLGPPEAGVIYPVRPSFPGGSGQKVAWGLSVLRPDVAPGLDSDRIALTQPDGSMDFYAKANYPDRVPPLVQKALIDGFEASGRIDAVAPEQAALHADYNLVIEVKDFAAHYAQVDGIPNVTVAITAKLTTAHGRVIVGSFSTTQTAAASANSAGAVVQALQQALGLAVKAIVDWTLTAPMPANQQPLATASPGKPAEQLLHDATRGSNRLRQTTPPQ